MPFYEELLILKTLGYLRVSTDKQDVANQRYSILEYAHKHKIDIDDFFSYYISSQKSTSERGIDELLDTLNRKDKLIVSELSHHALWTNSVSVETDMTSTFIFFRVS